MTDDDDERFLELEDIRAQIRLNEFLIRRWEQVRERHDRAVARRPRLAAQLAELEKGEADA